MPRLWLLTPLFAGVIGAVACVPPGRIQGDRRFNAPMDASASNDSGVILVPVDGGFDDAGNPIDGGFVVADSGTTTPRDGGTITPPDGSVVSPVYDNCPDNPHAIDAPITINDGTNTIARDPSVTSFLVPFGIDAAVFSLNSLYVDDGTNRLPAQFEAIGRWNGHRADCTKPLRYAYVHVSSVPAPGATTTWHVRSSAVITPEATTMAVVESPTQWQISTGVARFTVPRGRFVGVSTVELGNGSGGFDVVSQLPAGESAFFVDHAGVKSTADRDPWYFALERKGPQVATIAVRGFYGAGANRDLGYTVRLHFTAGSAVVRVEHTYYFGAVQGWGADGLTNSTEITRAWMRVPYAGATSTKVRGNATVLSPGAVAVRIEQGKRVPGGDESVHYAIEAGGNNLENGTYADHPFVAVLGPNGYALGTIARMATREPQGLRFDPASSELQLDFTSSPIRIGGARGIWAIGAVDFGRGDPSAARADTIQLAAERPLLGAPQPAYVNGTKTIGPYATRSTPATQAFFDIAGEIHGLTKTYLRDLRITGIQIWPDMPRISCYQDVNCAQQRNQLYEGGDNNYWNWSKPGIDEFFRTGNNDFIYDFSFPQALNYVEALAVRTDHDRITDSSVMGLAPCYGDSRGYGGDYREGLNNRRDRCVADYSYSKTLRPAFLATGDQRFVDFWEEAGESAVNAFGAPPLAPEPFLELTLNRLSEQRLELLTAGAEFARDTTSSQTLRSKLLEYVDFMLGRALIGGHSCDLGGSGQNDPRAMGQCSSTSAWMMPVGAEWATRASRFLAHVGLAEWLVQHAVVSGRNNAVLGANGLPDVSQSSAWRSGYQCATNASGVDDSTCAKVNGGENNGGFYSNGLVSYVNVFGIVLASDPSDPDRICEWLPAAFQSSLAQVTDLDLNFKIWGKASGQALGMSAEAAGAVSSCP